jgi:phosphate transport system protein
MNSHIDRYFDEALTSLKQQILLMGSKVEAMLADCMKALKSKDTKLAGNIIEADHSINALEVSIDEHCIHLLARYQPAASDLRFITRGLKIVTDLERIGDLAVNSAQRVIDIIEHGDPPLDLTRLSSLVQKMLKESLDSFVEMDVKKAESVLQSDDAVDELTRQYVTELIEMAVKEPADIKLVFPMSSLVRYLERISDHSTNIAELTIYMKKGRDVRHGKPH